MLTAHPPTLRADPRGHHAGIRPNLEQKRMSPTRKGPGTLKSEASHAQLAKQGEVESSLKRTPPDNGADELAVPPIGLPPLAGPEAQGTLPTALTGRAQFSLCVGLCVCVKPRLANTPSRQVNRTHFAIRIPCWDRDGQRSWITSPGPRT